MAIEKIEYRISINNSAGGMKDFKFRLDTWGAGKKVRKLTDLPTKGGYGCFEVDKLNVATKLSLFGPNNFAHFIEVKLDKPEDFPFRFLDCDAKLDHPPAIKVRTKNASEPEIFDDNTRRNSSFALDLGCTNVDVRVVDLQNKNLPGYFVRLWFPEAGQITIDKPTDANGSHGAKFNIRQSNHHLNAGIWKKGGVFMQTRVFLRPGKGNIVNFVLDE